LTKSRDNILARIRAANGGSDVPDATAREAMQTYIRDHKPGPRPLSDWEPVSRFRERALSLSSTLDQVDTMQLVPAAVARYLSSNNLPMRALCWPFLMALDWQASAIDAAAAGRAQHGDMVGITGCFCAIAETGTLVLLSGEATPATTSLVPETHVAVVSVARIVRNMEEAWALLRKEHGAMPRSVNFISGPSRTADIEQTLVLGAHGPYRVHIILIL
jgi:L-lactate dehydrogenase complex protein LldG